MAFQITPRFFNWFLVSNLKSYKAALNYSYCKFLEKENLRNKYNIIGRNTKLLVIKKGEI